MIPVTLVTFIDLFSLVFTLLLFGRVISSWIYPHPEANIFTRYLFELTEPILAPLRQVLPRVSMIDLAPLAAFFLLQGLVWLAHYWLMHL